MYTVAGRFAISDDSFSIYICIFKMAAASSAFHVWNDECLLALPDEWKHETIGSNMAVLF